MIRTERLTMIPVTRDLKLALQSSREAFGKKLNAVLPDGWPQLPQAFVPHDIEPAVPWCAYVFLDNRKRLLVGNGGFLSTLDKDADVEIGYEIASEYHNLGYGTQAARALMDLAFEHAGVRTVSATTLAETNASNRLLQKLGMAFVEEIDDAENGKIWRWQFKL